MYKTINNSSNWWAQLQSRRQSNYKWNAELVCTGNDNIPSVSPGMRQSDDDRISKIFKFSRQNDALYTVYSTYYIFVLGMSDVKKKTESSRIWKWTIFYSV